MVVINLQKGYYEIYFAINLTTATEQGISILYGQEPRGHPPAAAGLFMWVRCGL
jgi:hypothetical protein